jgi:membrane associated rhomboid family serine protease
MGVTIAVAQGGGKAEKRQSGNPAARCARRRSAPKLDFRRNKAATAGDLVKATGVARLLRRILAKSARRVNRRAGGDGDVRVEMGAGALDEREREPLFRAPWPVLALVGVLLAAFAMQTAIGADAVAAGLGFSAASLAQGRLAPLVVSLFLHGGWAHVLINAAFIVAFGAPVSRRFGTDGQGAVSFLVFFVVCGALANLGYALAHPGSPAIVVGASGAASGLMAGASRLMTREPGLAPLTSRPVISMSLAWLVVNLLLAVLGSANLWRLSPGTGGAPVAWEAHLAGYAAGLLLFGPALRLLRRG